MTDTTAADLARRAEAHARRQAINACTLCDHTGFISGRQRDRHGKVRDAAWRCDHTNRPLPAGFIPDPPT